MNFFKKVSLLFLLSVIAISCSDDDGDPLEEPVQKRVAFVDGPQATFDYSYNSDNRLSEIVLDWDSEETQVVKFTYNSGGQLVLVERGEIGSDPSNVATYEYVNGYPKIVATYTYLNIPYLEIHEYSAGQSRMYGVESFIIDQSQTPQDTISHNIYEIDEFGKTFNEEITHDYSYDSEVPNPIKYLDLPVAYDYGFVLWSFNMTSSETFYTAEFWPTSIERKDGTTNTYTYEYDEEDYLIKISIDGVVRSTIEWEEF